MGKRKCKKYYYVPSTYKGKKFKRKGKSGGAYRGCGRICGGSIDDIVSANVVQAMPTVTATAPIDIPVQPAQIEENILGFPNITPEMIERARQIIALAEATGKAQPITKKEAGIWSGLKNFGSKVWSGVKNVASNPYVQGAVKAAVPFALGALAPAAVPYVQKAADYMGESAFNWLAPRYKNKAIWNQSTGENVKDVVKNVVAMGKNAAVDTGETIVDVGKNVVEKGKDVVNAIINAATNSSEEPSFSQKVFNGIRGFFGRKASGYGGAYRGCGRKSRLRKGSPEAKAYMAMLRRMKGKKKGKGVGGAYRAGAYRAGAYRGCGRKGHLKKGSPEAKAYMAMLRRIRGKKKSSKKGGMFRGVTENSLLNIYERALNAGHNKADVNWMDENGHIRTTAVSLKKIENMLNGTDKIKNFYKIEPNGRVRTRAEESDFRSLYLSQNHGERRWPYKMMGVRREKKLKKQIDSLNRHYSNAKMTRARNYWQKRASPALYEYLINKLNRDGTRDKDQNDLLNAFFPNKGSKQKLKRLRKLSG